MAKEKEKIFEIVKNHPKSEEIYSFCVGWLKSHFSNRNSIKLEEIIEMLEEAIHICGSSENN